MGDMSAIEGATDTSRDERAWLFLDGHTWADMDAWHARVAEIRRQEPVLAVDVEGFEPFWVLTRHEDVFAVSRDSEHWLNTTRSVLGPDADWEQMLATGMPEPKTLVHLDGPEHRKHRHVTNDWFKPAAVRHRQPRIDQLADHFLERMRALGGECDFAKDIAQPYTLRVIMDIYGVPEEDEPLMLELTQGIIATAGHDTTSFALAGGVEAFLRHPEQFEALRQDPELAVNATDEIIRWTSPVRHFLRYATEPVEIRDVAIPADGRVLLSYPSANRDEDVFQDSMRFDVRRPDADKLLSFGVGAHFCLGSQFARREVRTMIAKMAEQLDHIEPAGEPEWAQAHFVSGVKHLPVRYAFT
jgi:cytochrome P450